MTDRKRLIIGITGASGFVYGVRLLEVLREHNIETHLVISKAAELTRKTESNLTHQQVQELANHYYPVADVSASIASGSFKTMGMIIAPCSMRTLAEIATGVTSSLLTRAADVVLKERRKLILMVRETPLTSVHIENMLKATQAGAIIAPPVPAFYSQPQSLDDMINHTIGRVLDLFDLEVGLVKRWTQHPTLHR